MKHLQPVIWSKGTFLTPQHLQSQDRYFESLLNFYGGALHFRPWGFSRMNIAQEAIATGTFAVSSASGILPDGLLFDIPDSDPSPEARPFGDFFDKEQGSLDVYLAIPVYHERGINISMNGRTGTARYRAEVSMLRDENSGSSEKPVQMARKNLRFLLEGESREGTSAMRVARVLRHASGTFHLDPRFVPPLLDFGTSDYLVSIARRLVEILSSRSASLGGLRRQKNQTLADFTSSDIANFWLLYTINTYLPLVRHLFESRRGHPEPLFSTMLALAGSLTTFSFKIQPRDLPRYDHDELGACFADLDEKLRFLMETVVPSNFVSLPLRLEQPSIYATAIDDDKYLQNTKMYIAINAEMNQADLINKTEQLIKVHSANQIEHLVRQALPGVKLTHLPTPPNAIPVKLNYEYFSLNQSGPAWEAITRSRNLGAYVPGDFPNPQIELVVLLPRPS